MKILQLRDKVTPIMLESLLCDELFDDVGVIMLEGVIMLVDMLVVVYTVVVGCSPV